MDKFLNGFTIQYYKKRFIILFLFPVVIDIILMIFLSRFLILQSYDALICALMAIVTLPSFTVAGRYLFYIYTIKNKGLTDIHHIKITKDMFTQKGTRFCLNADFYINNQVFNYRSNYIFTKQDILNLDNKDYFIGVSEKLKMVILSESTREEN